MTKCSIEVSVDNQELPEIILEADLLERNDARIHEVHKSSQQYT